MGDDVLVQVVAQIAIEAGADILVHGLEFDKHQRQAVHKTHQIGAAVVIGRTQTGELELAHHQKTIVGRRAEIDHGGLRMAKLALRTAIADRHTVPHQLVERLVVLQQRAREIVVGQFRNGLIDGTGWQLRVEPGQRRSQVAHQHHIARADAPESAIQAKGFLIPCMDAVPVEHFLQVLGNRGLYQAVFAVDVGVGHQLLSIGQTIES